MPTPIFISLAEAEVFVETVAHFDEVRQALAAGGYNDATQAQGKAAIKAAYEALEHVAEELQEDKLIGHLVHTAATELEMWLQTARFRARKVLGEGAELDRLMGADLHGHDHTVAVFAQALRFKSVVRLDEGLRARLDDRMSVEDLLQRGKALMIKAVRLAEANAHPDNKDADAVLAGPVKGLDAFLKQAHDAASRALAARPELMGLLGFVPDEMGIPLGGTANSVTRHERTFREAPVGGPSRPAPGWSVGRQGRNSQNRGKGY